MIKALVSDVSRVLLFPIDDDYKGSLNRLYKEIKDKPSGSFFSHFRVNEELLDYYKKLTNKLDFYIFTSDIIQDAPELQTYWKDIFKEIYSASKMNVNKSEESAYKKLIQKLNQEPNQILYIDDNNINIASAKQTGLHTILYKSNKKLFQQIEHVTE